MPELPDITIYVEALERCILGREIQGIRLQSPFLVRTFDPPLSSLEGRTVRAVRRMGKRIVWDLEADLFASFHLMIAGRFHWRPPRSRLRGRSDLAAFDFENGTLVLTEASTKKRAALQVVRGESELRKLDRGGIEALEASFASFRDTLKHSNHTLKRALTDPSLFAGIGNAYSDEILHRARLSPFQLTRNLNEPEVKRLHRAVRDVLSEWTERLRKETGDGFPEKVTAFRDGMAVHGRYRKPCPTCGSPVQRISYAENEANYCATCQTGGKLLADRALSRLLKQDWPKTLEDLERLRDSLRGAAP